MPAGRFLNSTDLAALPPRRWLVPGLLTRGSLALIYGPPRSLRSFVALDLLLRLAHGHGWQGDPTPACDVLYVAGEGAAGMGARVAAWERRHGKQEERFHLVPDGLNLLDAAEVEAFTKEAGRRFGGGVGLVVVNTLARSMIGGNENSHETMSRAIAAANHLRATLGCTVALVHHTGKDRSRGPRGHGSLFAAVDSALEVVRDEGGAPSVQVSVRKQKDAEEGPPIDLFGRVIDLELIEGEPRSSLVLTDEEPPDTLALAVAGKKVSAGRRAIAAVMAEPGETVSVSALMGWLDGRPGFSRNSSLARRIKDAITAEPCGVVVGVDDEERTLRWVQHIDGQPASKMGFLMRLK